MNQFYDGWRVIEEQSGLAFNATTETPTDFNQVGPTLAQYVGGVFMDETLVMDRNRNGNRSAVEAGVDQRLFYHHNAQFSVHGLTDEMGRLVEGYQYDAFGVLTIYQPRGAAGPVTFDPNQDRVVVGSPATDGTAATGFAVASAVGNPYTYTGQRYDPEGVGHLYYKNRYYQSTRGRFLSRDPASSADGPNLYAYVRNAPTVRIDPYGLQGEEAATAASTTLDLAFEMGEAAASSEGRKILFKGASVVFAAGQAGYTVWQGYQDTEQFKITGWKFVSVNRGSEIERRFLESRWLDAGSKEEMGKPTVVSRGAVDPCSCTMPVTYRANVWKIFYEQEHDIYLVGLREYSTFIYEMSFVLKLDQAAAGLMGIGASELATVGTISLMGGPVTLAGAALAVSVGTVTGMVAEWVYESLFLTGKTFVTFETSTFDPSHTEAYPRVSLEKKDSDQEESRPGLRMFLSPAA